MKLFNIFKRKQSVSGKQVEWKPKKVPNGKIISVDFDRTQKYYIDDEYKDRCYCGSCKTYYAEIKERYPILDEYLSKMGVDVSKPLEAPSMGLGKNKQYKEYFAWYVVFGECDVDFAIKLGDLTIYRQLSYPPTNLDEMYFVLEITGIVFK